MSLPMSSLMWASFVQPMSCTVVKSIVLSRLAVMVLFFGTSSTPTLSTMPWLFLFFVSSRSLSTRIALRSSALLLNSSSIAARRGLSCSFTLPVLEALVKSFLSMTTPLSDGLALSEASFTSPALSPKMARSSFSSGLGSLSPLGVILPIMMSPGATRAPIRMIPFSSRSFVASSLTLGMSAVSSSMPRFVSRTSRENSSTWTLVRISSRTTRSLSTMASS